MNQYRDFTAGELTFPVPAVQAFLARLHAACQHHVPIVDPNIYPPDPTNATDAYGTYTRGAEIGAFISNPHGTLFWYNLAGVFRSAGLP